MGTLFGGAFLIVIVILAVSIFLHFVPLGLWVSAISANVSVSIMSLIRYASAPRTAKPHRTAAD